MPNPSPLRYPGGKNKLSQFMSTVIKNTDCFYNTFTNHSEACE